MTLRLHGGPLSPFVRKVAICLIEKGLLERTELIRSPTAMVTPNLSLMALNPLSKIPTLVTEEGVALYDSDVICEYLDATFEQPRLTPPDAPERWAVLRRTALASGALDALVLWNFMRNQPAEQQSAQAQEALAIKTRASLAQVEEDVALLREGQFNLAAITTGCLFGYLGLRFADLNWRDEFPGCARWFAAFEERPSARMTAPYPHHPDARQDPALRGRLYWDEP